MKSPLVWVLICLNILLCLFLFSEMDRPAVKAAKGHWDNRILDEMVYIRDPRNGDCYRRVSDAYALTYHPVTCMSVQSVLVNP